MSGKVVSSGGKPPYIGELSSLSDPYSSPAANGISGLNTNPAFSTRSTALLLYSDCEKCFFEQRKRLLEPSVAAHVKSLADVKNMIALTRLGSTYILRVYQLERQLYEHSFPLGDASGDESSVLLSSLHTKTINFLAKSRGSVALTLELLLDDSYATAMYIAGKQQCTLQRSVTWHHKLPIASRHTA